MLTIDEAKQIGQQICLENGIAEDDLREEISEIVYRVDVFECEDAPIMNRHIDIEYTFGDYCEIRAENPLFQFICTLCSLSLEQVEEEELILYQKGNIPVLRAAK